ncbi:MAG: DUF2243 domain-containing protein [Mesorhizobium sp.]|nr:MAG: DUF2243 domain-containing protein [Mesorhizobium sp.]
MNERNSAAINGALMAIGALGIVDNIVFHWILRLHRAVPGQSALFIEVMLVIVSIGLIAVGIRREMRERQ